MTPKRLLFVEDPVAHVGEQQIERVGADQIRSNELMDRIDHDVVGHNVEQRPSIDHVSGHIEHSTNRRISQRPVVVTSDAAGCVHVTAIVVAMWQLYL